MIVTSSLNLKRFFVTQPWFVISCNVLGIVCIWKVKFFWEMDRVALQIPCDFQMMQSINGTSLTQHEASQPNWRVPCFSYPKTREKKEVWSSWDYMRECIAYDSGYCDELLVLPFQEYWIHRVSIVVFLSGFLHFWEKYCMHVLVGKVWFPWRQVCKTYRGIWCQREGHLNKFKRCHEDMWALLYMWMTGH